MKLGILCPGYGHARGGVIDHTRRIARSWSKRGPQVLVADDLRVDPRALAARWHEEAVTAVLIQYVPFLYGRRGLSRFPLQLTRSLRQLGVRTVVFAHESWVPPSRLPWLLLSPLQRNQLRAIAGNVDVVVTPVPEWRSEIGGNAVTMYVGSNLGVPPESARHEMEPSPVVFSPFASGLRWDWIAAAVQAIDADPPLTLIGADASSGRVHAAVGKFHDSRWRYLGRLDAPEVLARLMCAPVVLAPYIDGITGRRTTVMGALSVGTPVITSAGRLFDSFFDRPPVRTATSKGEFVELAARIFRQQIHDTPRRQPPDWYRTELDPDVLDEKLLKVMLGS